MRTASTSSWIIYFGRGSGLVSATFFRTDAKDLQRTVQELLGPDGFQGDPTYAGFMATSKDNVAKSHNAGVRAHSNLQLGSLNERLRGIGVSANYTQLLPTIRPTTSTRPTTRQRRFQLLLQETEGGGAAQLDRRRENRYRTRCRRCQCRLGEL